MFLKKVLNQPNLVGTILITLMVCGGFVYAVGFDGFNVQTATDGEVEAWLAAAGGGSSGGSGGGGSDDMSPEEPAPEDPEDGEDNPDEGEGDPPEDEDNPPEENPGDCDCGHKHCHVLNDDGTTKKGCKQKKSNGRNPCADQTRKYPCPASADCRGKGGGAHSCTNQGCEKMPKPNGQPGKIDVCKKSPKKTCKGGSSKC